MRQLVLTPKFKRTHRKFVRRNKKLEQHIIIALRQMEQDIFAPSLTAHKLGGILVGFWACSCGYDCRIVFSLEIDPASGNEVIVLLDIGTHDKVY